MVIVYNATKYDVYIEDFSSSLENKILDIELHPNGIFRSEKLSIMPSMSNMIIFDGLLNKLEEGNRFYDEEDADEPIICVIDSCYSTLILKKKSVFTLKTTDGKYIGDIRTYSDDELYHVPIPIVVSALHNFLYPNIDNCYMGDSIPELGRNNRYMKGENIKINTCAVYDLTTYETCSKWISNDIDDYNPSLEVKRDFDQTSSGINFYDK